jgi:predicted O-methyltransferase YrrM
MPPHPVIQFLDSDNDGVLSPGELESAPSKLRQFDGNHDGQLAANELPISHGLLLGPFRGGFPTPWAYPSPLISKDSGEAVVLDALEKSRQGPRYANISPSDGRLLRLLAESVDAQRIVELGTSTGESGLWLALALRRTGGHLYTHDIDAGRARIARSNFQEAGVDSLVTVIEGDAHETIKQHRDPIDVLFLDADTTGYHSYLKTLLPLVRPGGLIIALNLKELPTDSQFFRDITTNPELDTSFLHMDGSGMSVTLKKR